MTAVGGTTLNRASNARGWTETAWRGAGCGLLGRTSPSRRGSTTRGCAKRTVADVSAVADPNTGVAVYDSYGYQGRGWMVFGGTSVASPIVAGVYALAGNGAGDDVRLRTVQPHGARSTTSTAAPTAPARGTYLCTAVAGYDGPTGLGTPNGIGAF